MLHNNVRSLQRNLENFQVHLLDELDYDFSLIGVSETKINSLRDFDFDPSILGYAFEHVPTPLASGGVGLYINDSLKYTVIEKTSEEEPRRLSMRSGLKCNLRGKVTSSVV